MPKKEPATAVADAPTAEPSEPSVLDRLDDTAIAEYLTTYRVESIPADQLALRFRALREPFPPSEVGKLPKPTSKDAAKGKCLPRTGGGDAPDWQDYYCGGYHGLPAVHLDYVGHGYVTHRLLAVDPLWSWEPLQVTEQGLPRFDRDGGRAVGLWVKLTVLGVTRLGYGSCSTGQFDAEKVLVGDALRNAAMRFGVALDLWCRGVDEPDATGERTSAPAPAPTVPDGMSEDELADRRALFQRFAASWRAMHQAGRKDDVERALKLVRDAGMDPNDPASFLTADLDTVLVSVEEVEAIENPPPAPEPGQEAQRAEEDDVPF